MYSVSSMFEELIKRGFSHLTAFNLLVAYVVHVDCMSLKGARTYVIERLAECKV